MLQLKIPIFILSLSTLLLLICVTFMLCTLSYCTFVQYLRQTQTYHELSMEWHGKPCKWVGERWKWCSGKQKVWSNWAVEPPQVQLPAGGRVRGHSWFLPLGLPMTALSRNTDNTSAYVSKHRVEAGYSIEDSWVHKQKL